VKSWKRSEKSFFGIQAIITIHLCSFSFSFATHRSPSRQVHFRSPGFLVSLENSVLKGLWVNAGFSEYLCLPCQLLLQCYITTRDTAMWITMLVELRAQYKSRPSICLLLQRAIEFSESTELLNICYTSHFQKVFLKRFHDFTILESSCLGEGEWRNANGFQNNLEANCHLPLIWHRLGSRSRQAASILSATA
jgi:hypothetical protein